MQCCKYEDSIPEPTRILGLALNPFCLGHHLLFKRLGLPFAEQPDAPADMADVLVGAAICAHNYTAGLALLWDDCLSGFISGWERRIVGRWPFRRKPDMPGAVELFRSYLRRGYSRPKIWTYDNVAGVKLSAPWEELLLVRLVASGFGPVTVLDEYLPAAWFHYFTVLELAQAAHLTDPAKWRKVFFDDEDEQLQRMAKEAECSSN